MFEPKTKGIAFGIARAFASERFGDHAWAEILTRLTPLERAEIANALPVGRYSLAIYARLLRAIDEAFGAGDLALVVRLGRFGAEQHMALGRRPIAFAKTPDDAAKRFAESFRRLHDRGVWEVETVADRQIRGMLADWGIVEHALCRELVGRLGRTFELTGASGVFVEHPRCRALGDGECVFLARWGAETVNAPPAAEPSLRREHQTGVIKAPADAAFASSIERLEKLSAGSDRRRASGD